VLQIPVALNAQRGVQIRFARNDNITAVVEGFVDFYELTEVYIVYMVFLLPSWVYCQQPCCYARIA
jgi:hypothetical protein